MSNQIDLLLGPLPVKSPELVDVRIVEKIKNIRQAYRTAISLSGLDQHEVAERLGLDNGRLSNIINADKMEDPKRIKHMPDEAKARFADVVGNFLVEQYVLFRKGFAVTKLDQSREQALESRLSQIEDLLRKTA